MYLLAISYMTLGVVLAMTLATPTLLTSPADYVSSPLSAFFSTLFSPPSIAVKNRIGELNENPKTFSGFRLKNDSLQMVYFHDQTIAIVELGANKVLLSCELIEVYNDADGSALLTDLGATVNRPLGIEFMEMLQLMSQCQTVDNVPNIEISTPSEPIPQSGEYIYGTDNAMYGDDIDYGTTSRTSKKVPVKARQSILLNQRQELQQYPHPQPERLSQQEQIERQKQIEMQQEREEEEQEARGFMTAVPMSLFSGIVPGTKWCGTGDIATTYHDLGSDTESDKCCRTHDLCPIKVRAFRQRYNLTNNSLYTKSHCLCDDMLFQCLRDSKTPASLLMGNIYFNLIRVPCVQDSNDGKKRFRGARRGF